MTEVEHKNGKEVRGKMPEGSLKNGKREGVWTFWHKNGQKRSEGPYKAGEQEGVWTFWYENGNVMKAVTYKNGVGDW